MSSIIFFDGVCNLCNSAVDFLIKRDHKDHFKFASLQGETAKKLLDPSDLEKLHSMILLENDTTYYRSDAALKIFSKLGGFWSISQVLLLIPRFIRDTVYKLVAKNRYRWFGQREVCRVPSEEERIKFLL